MKLPIRFGFLSRWDLKSGLLQNDFAHLCQIQTSAMHQAMNVSISDECVLVVPTPCPALPRFDIADLCAAERKVGERFPARGC